MTNPSCNAAYKAKDITSENFTHKIILLSMVLFMIFFYAVWCLSLVSWKCGKVSVWISSRTENQMSRSRTIGSRLQANMHSFLRHCKIARASFWMQGVYIVYWCTRSRLHPCCIHLQLQCSTQSKKSFSLTLLMQNLWSRFKSQLSEECLRQYRVETESPISPDPSLFCTGSWLSWV